jgi:hypothetical protein
MMCDVSHLSQWVGEWRESAVRIGELGIPETMPVGRQGGGSPALL